MLIVIYGEALGHTVSPQPLEGPEAKVSHVGISFVYVSKPQ